MKTRYLDESGTAKPPWLVYPKIPPGSIGWRMGAGEDYWYEFVDWFSAQDSASKLAYIRKYPKPESWRTFWPYDPNKLASYTDRKSN